MALRVARELGGEVVSCDSVQIYRGFDIGSAKLPKAERRGIPHHLLDLVEPAQLFTAGEYSRVARKTLREIAERGRMPVVVGGTGFYLRALIDGLAPGPKRDQTLRDRLNAREEKRPGSLHRILARLDPQAGARIHPRDKNKTLRALEVRLVERRPMSALFEQGRDALIGFQLVRIGLNPPRELLGRRLDQRTRGMFERGLIEEVRGLLARGVPPDAKPFESLGYRQALEVIQERSTLEAALAATQLETRQYAKRQMTWFRREPSVLWLAGFGDEPSVQDQALQAIREAGTGFEPVGV